MNDENANDEGVKTRLINLVLDNGLPITLMVVFCVALYWIMQKQQDLLLKTLIDVTEHRNALIEQLLESYKYKEN